MNENSPDRIVRIPWWESVATTHSDVPTAMAAALRRGVDVDEDTGAPGLLVLPRIQPAGEPGIKDVALDLTAITAALGQLDLAANSRGWELVGGRTLIGRQTRAFMSELRDVVEAELTTDEVGRPRAPRILVNVLGPWSFGASVELGGHPIMADRPAFRDVALTLGEGIAAFCDWLSAATGAEVIVGLHEPLVAEILDGLPGPTRWSSLKPVDREHVIGVWRRLRGQLPPRVPVLLHDCPQSLLGDIAEAGFTSVGIPLDHVTGEHATTAAKDAVGALIGAGQSIGLRVATGDVAMGDATTGDAAVTRDAGGVRKIEDSAATIAGKVTRLWSQWSFEPELLVERVSVFVATAREGRTQELVLSPASAASQAAIARTAARNLATG